LIDGHKQAVLPIVPECPFAFGGFGRQRKTLSNDEFDRVTRKIDGRHQPGPMVDRQGSAVVSWCRPS
jgi:hypothetical protein